MEYFTDFKVIVVEGVTLVLILFGAIQLLAQKWIDVRKTLQSAGWIKTENKSRRRSRR